MNDNKIKRRDKPYTAVAVKDDKIVMFFFQKYTLFVFRSTPGKLFCGSNVVFKGKFFKKIYRIIPIDLPKKWLISASSFI